MLSTNSCVCNLSSGAISCCSGLVGNNLLYPCHLLRQSIEISDGGLRSLLETWTKLLVTSFSFHWGCLVENAVLIFKQNMLSFTATLLE